MQHEAITTFFRHTKRPSWGLAIMSSQLENKRRYQFEDGELRTIANGYYHMLEPAPAPKDGDSRIAQLLLERDLGRARRRLDQMDTTANVVSLRQQLDWFASTYEGGFDGVTWKEQHRMRAKGSALKRHRDPVLEDAKKLFTQENLQTVQTAEHADAWLDRLHALLKRTDCVRAKELKGLSTVPDALELVRNLDAWLYGEGEARGRFRKFVYSFNEPSWSLVTTIGALALPTVHIAVSTSAFTRLAMFLQPNMDKFTGRPTWSQYQAVLQMVEIVRLQLLQSGHEPTDVMDVRDFICDTLRPKVIDEITHPSA